eukprot:2862979-Prymnesium_polylepis.1
MRLRSTCLDQTLEVSTSERDARTHGLGCKPVSLVGRYPGSGHEIPRSRRGPPVAYRFTQGRGPWTLDEDSGPWTLDEDSSRTKTIQKKS